MDDNSFYDVSLKRRTKIQLIIKHNFLTTPAKIIENISTELENYTQKILRLFSTIALHPFSNKLTATKIKK